MTGNGNVIEDPAKDVGTEEGNEGEDDAKLERGRPGCLHPVEGKDETISGSAYGEAEENVCDGFEKGMAPALAEGGFAHG